MLAIRRQYPRSIDMSLHRCLIQFGLFIISFLDFCLSPGWSSHDPSQYSDDVFKQWCMKFGQIKTFVLPHWLIIWQIGALLCVDTVKEPSTTHPPPNKEATCRKKFLYSSPFLFFVRRLHFFTTFWNDKMGENCGLFGGGPCVLRQWQRGPGQQSVAV